MLSGSAALRFPEIAGIDRVWRGFDIEVVQTSLAAKAMRKDCPILVMEDDDNNAALLGTGILSERGGGLQVDAAANITVTTGRTPYQPIRYREWMATPPVLRRVSG
jgi:hypothetical protein